MVKMSIETNIPIGRAHALEGWKFWKKVWPYLGVLSLTARPLHEPRQTWLQQPCYNAEKQAEFGRSWTSYQAYQARFETQRARHTCYGLSVRVRVTAVLAALPARDFDIYKTQINREFFRQMVVNTTIAHWKRIREMKTKSK